MMLLLIIDAAADQCALSNFELKSRRADAQSNMQ